MPSADKIGMNVCQNMCILMGENLAVFRNSCLSLHDFLFKITKINCFEKKMGLVCSFFIKLRAGDFILVYPIDKNTEHLKFWVLAAL